MDADGGSVTHRRQSRAPNLPAAIPPLLRLYSLSLSLSLHTSAHLYGIASLTHSYRIYGIISLGSCLAMELWNNETGKLMCRQEPIYGGTGDTTVGDKFNEPGKSNGLGPASYCCYTILPLKL